MSSDTALRRFGLGALKGLISHVRLNREALTYWYQNNITVREINLPISRCVLYRILTGISLRVSPSPSRAQNPQLKLKPIRRRTVKPSLEFSLHKPHLRHLHGLKKTKWSLKMTHGKELQGVDLGETVGDFRFLYLRILGRRTNKKLAHFGAVNLNLFNYRTNN